MIAARFFQKLGLLGMACAFAGAIIDYLDNGVMPLLLVGFAAAVFGVLVEAVESEVNKE